MSYELITTLASFVLSIVVLITVPILIYALIQIKRDKELVFMMRLRLDRYSAILDQLYKELEERQ